MCSSGGVRVLRLAYNVLAGVSCRRGFDWQRVCGCCQFTRTSIRTHRHTPVSVGGAAAPLAGLVVRPPCNNAPKRVAVCLSIHGCRQFGPGPMRPTPSPLQPWVLFARSQARASPSIGMLLHASAAARSSARNSVPHPTCPSRTPLQASAPFRPPHHRDTILRRRHAMSSDARLQKPPKWTPPPEEEKQPSPAPALVVEETQAKPEYESPSLKGVVRLAGQSFISKGQLTAYFGHLLHNSRLNVPLEGVCLRRARSRRDGLLFPLTPPRSARTHPPTRAHPPPMPRPRDPAQRVHRIHYTARRQRLRARRVPPPLPPPHTHTHAPPHTLSPAARGCGHSTTPQGESCRR